MYSRCDLSSIQSRAIICIVKANPLMYSMRGSYPLSLLNYSFFRLMKPVFNTIFDISHLKTCDSVRELVFRARHGGTYNPSTYEIEVGGSEV